MGSFVKTCKENGIDIHFVEEQSDGYVIRYSHTHKIFGYVTARIYIPTHPNESRNDAFVKFFKKMIWKT